MHKTSKQSMVLLVVIYVFVFSVGASALAQDQYQQSKRSAEKMVADAIFLRPLGFVSTVLGSAVFIVSLPFSAIGGNSGEAFNKMVKEPAEYTFVRPLGDN